MTERELYCPHGTFPDACFVCLEAEITALKAKVEALTKAAQAITDEAKSYPLDSQYEWRGEHPIAIELINNLRRAVEVSDEREGLV